MISKITRPQIREVFLRNGARIEPDRDDLPDWIYESAFELLELAAPAVQGEPVAVLLIGEPEHTTQGWELGDWDIEPNATAIEAFARVAEPGAYQLCLAPQSAVQGEPGGAEHQPCPEGIRGGAPYDDPAFESLCREYGIWGTAAAAQCAVFWGAGKRVAEQKPAPDVAGLVDALVACRDDLLWMIERHNQQDQNDGSWLYDHQTVVEADAALAAHRKGGGK